MNESNGAMRGTARSSAAKNVEVGLMITHKRLDAHRLYKLRRYRRLGMSPQGHRPAVPYPRIRRIIRPFRRMTVAIRLLVQSLHGVGRSAC